MTLSVNDYVLRILSNKDHLPTFSIIHGIELEQKHAIFPNVRTRTCREHSLFSLCG